MLSKTQISKRTLRKRNLEIVETIKLAKKNNLLDLAKKLSGPSRLYKKINLDELNNVKSNNIIIIGKVLGSGEVNKKMNVAALGFSEKAREKLKKAGCDVKKIKEIVGEINEFEIIK